MANQQDNTEKCPDICKAVLAETFRNTVTVSGWTKLATRTSGREQTKFKVRYTFLREDGMASPHLEKAKQQHYETGLGVKNSGQGKGGVKKTPGDMTLKQISRKWG